MKLYKLAAHARRGWDEFRAFVIVAPSPGAARRIAGRTAAILKGDPERAALERQLWDDPTGSLCLELGPYTGPETTAHVVVSDFYEA